MNSDTDNYADSSHDNWTSLNPARNQDTNTTTIDHEFIFIKHPSNNAVIIEAKIILKPLYTTSIRRTFLITAIPTTIRAKIIAKPGALPTKTATEAKAEVSTAAEAESEVVTAMEAEALTAAAKAATTGMSTELPLSSLPSPSSSSSSSLLSPSSSPSSSSVPKKYDADGGYSSGFINGDLPENYSFLIDDDQPVDPEVRLNVFSGFFFFLCSSVWFSICNI